MCAGVNDTVRSIVCCVASAFRRKDPAGTQPGPHVLPATVRLPRSRAERAEGRDRGDASVSWLPPSGGRVPPEQHGPPRVARDCSLATISRGARAGPSPRRRVCLVASAFRRKDPAGTQPGPHVLPATVRLPRSRAERAEGRDPGDVSGSWLPPSGGRIPRERSLVRACCKRLFACHDLARSARRAETPETRLSRGFRLQAEGFPAAQHWSVLY